MKLDKTDKKLLSYLYHHYREPFTDIAKACKISRTQVEYRMRKYENEGLIKKYMTIFNYSFLGYKELIIIWLKVAENHERIKKELEKMINVITVGEILNDYDLVADCIFKDREEFEKVFSDFLSKHQNDIEDYSIFLTTYAEFFPLKSFDSNYQEKSFEVINPEKPIKLDEKEIEILKLLEKNGRTRIIDIAGKTNLSSELVLYKLKQLYKNKVILGTKILFDMEKQGFYFGVLNLKLNNLTKERQNEIKEFCRFHKYINALSFGISEYNCIVQAFYEKEEEFRTVLKDFKNKFKNNIEKSKIILYENEGEVKTLPLTN
ncbi:MAG: Lrp/AsnC family transcriptional regulator [Nanoarchaeota archaeon]